MLVWGMAPLLPPPHRFTEKIVNWPVAGFPVSQKLYLYITMWRIFLYFMLFWFLYNLVFRFIIPVYRTSKKMKQQFAEMQERMQQTMNPKQHATANAGGPAPQQTPSKGNKSDYIDFEEVD